MYFYWYSVLHALKTDDATACVNGNLQIARFGTNAIMSTCHLIAGVITMTFQSGAMLNVRVVLVEMY